MKRAKAEVTLAPVRIAEIEGDSDQDAARRERVELGADLKALRLAKEEADADNTDEAASTPDSPPRLPNVHRRQV